jgi:scyllo-inositol 2-dehydrogenase (NAD+)
VLGDDRARLWPDADRWLPYSHASAILKAGGELVALCDTNADALRAASERFSVRKTYRDYRSMIQEESLDIVSVATRTSIRPEILMHAAKHRMMGIYCEKPLSRTLEEADAIVDLVPKAGTAFVYGPQRRYMSGFVGVRQAIVSGRIGPVRDISIRWPAGPLLWRHPHSVDLACFLAGDVAVEAVRAKLRVALDSVRGHIVDSDPIVESATIQFADGIAATVTSDDSHIVEVRGTSGAIVVEKDGLRTTLRSGGAREDLTDVSSTSGTVAAMQALMSSVRQYRRPQYGIANAVLNQEVLFGWLESSLSGGRTVAFPIKRQARLITGRTGDKFA